MKYGLFIHYGIYSFWEGRYQGEDCPFYSEWIQHSFSIPSQEYIRPAQGLGPEKFDAKSFVLWAKNQGFDYLVITAKHHDGFCLFSSHHSQYNGQKFWGRDLIGELSEACKEVFLPLGLYYSQAQDWYHGGLRAYDESRGGDFDEYFKRICLPQLKELLTNYGQIELLWFDTPMSMKKEQIAQVRSLVKSLQPSCLVSGRIGKGFEDYLVTGDNMLPSSFYTKDWEMPMSLTDSWGYKKNDILKPKEDVLRTIARAFSRGGRVLLNIGPQGDFSLPAQGKILLERMKEPIVALIKAMEKAEFVFYPYEDDNLFLLKDKKTLYLFISDERNFLGLYNLTSKVKEVTFKDEKIAFVQKRTLEGDPYLGIELGKKAPCLLKVSAFDEIAFLPFG